MLIKLLEKYLSFVNCVKYPVKAFVRQNSQRDFFFNLGYYIFRDIVGKVI